MSDGRMRRTLDALVVVLVLAAVAAAPFFVALFLGFAWGLLAAMAVGAGIAWLAGHAGMNGGAEVLFFGGAAVVVGFIAGFALRLLS